ncbi:response regulator [Sphingomonas arenae]|nr:response regulator [Sphingomonas arenae]
MFDFLKQFVSGNYAPHGYCLLWQPELVWTHVISDALIAAAYFSIPVALVTFVRRRPDVEFGKMFWLFALFILSCGLTHVMGIWNLWNGDYGAEALVKAVTAAASVPTAILLWPLLPRMLAIPSPTQLQLKNQELAVALAERDEVLQQLRAEVQQRERAEAALVQAKKIEAVGQLTGGIAHDFNNLLQAIAGNLELITRSPERVDKVQRWATNATAAVERGTKLTGQLLTFSRQQRLEARAIHVGKMLEDMRELLRNSVGPTVQLELQISDDLCPVESDRTQLELAVLNLAINARDAMPGGGQLVIAAEMREVADGLPQVAVIVSDTGDGMSPEVQERALEPFFTTKGPGEGTGLGLPMAYGVATQAGGDLLIDTAVGEGTTVTMLLPCNVTAPEEPPSDSTKSGEHAAVAGHSILLVDDDHEVREALADLLAADGHACVEARGAAEALDAISRQSFDLLLLDYAMPEMNGAELASQARKLRPDMKLLFITGFADSAAIDRAVGGNARVLKKPVTSAQLAAAVREMLG